VHEDDGTAKWMACPVALDGRHCSGEESNALREKVKAARRRQKEIGSTWTNHLHRQRGFGTLVAAHHSAKVVRSASLRLCHLGSKFSGVSKSPSTDASSTSTDTEAAAVSSFSKGAGA